ncbi:substrate-binding domain-containing protein, partial [Escherichia coli]
VPGFAHRCVGLDNVSGALMATRMLLNHGHQRIGYLSSNHGIEDDDMRREGWSKALQEQGIIAPDSWVGSGSPDMQGGEAAMVELLGRNLGLTAVFAYNDSMAAGALTTLKDNGIVVPQHLSLIGFDDIPISRYT